jgi:hypothetical protein
MFPVPYELALGAEATVETVSVPNIVEDSRYAASLDSKRAGEAREFLRGLEIVNIDFETGDPETDTPRLKAFIAHYGITYPVLLGGTTDQLAEKIPQGVNLNCWPTSFFIGRDGLVKQTHAGFAGPGNTVGHAQLEDKVTALVEKLLAESATAHTPLNGAADTRGY